MTIGRPAKIITKKWIKPIDHECRISEPKAARNWNVLNLFLIGKDLLEKERKQTFQSESSLIKPNVLKTLSMWINLAKST